MTVTHNTTATIAGTEIHVTFTFVESDDPFVIQMDFLVPNDDVITWVFDKSLLFDAFERGRAGQGDITVVHGVEDMEFFLNSPSGEARFNFDAESLHYFVQMVRASSDSEHDAEVVERELSLFLNDVLHGKDFDV